MVRCRVFVTYQFSGEIMLKKICVGLITVLAVIQGLAGLEGGSAEIVMLLLAVAGVVYGIVGVDAEDATAYCVVALAVGAAAHADVLSHIHVVGAYLDAILDPAVVALYSGVASILAMRTYNRLMG